MLKIFSKTLLRTPLKEFSILSSAEFITKILVTFSTVIIARYLGPTEFGKFSYALAFTGFFIVISDFGIINQVLREGRAELLNSKLKYYLTFKFLILGASIFLAFFTSLALAKTSEVFLLVFVIILYSLINSFTDFFRAIFRVVGIFRYDAYTKIFQSILLLLFIYSCSLFNLNLIFIATSFLFSSILGFLIAYYLIVKKITIINYAFNLFEFAKISRESLLFVISGLLVFVYMKIDVFMLSWIKGDDITGIYTALYSFLYALIFIPGSLIAVFYPKISEIYKDGKYSSILRIYTYLLIIFFCISACISLMVHFFSTQIIGLLFGEMYISGASTMKIISLALIFSFLSHANLVVLNSIRLEKFYLIATLLSAILNVVLNLYLIPDYSFYGAAVATLAAEFVGFVFCVCVILRKLV